MHVPFKKFIYSNSSCRNNILSKYSYFRTNRKKLHTNRHPLAWHSFLPLHFYSSFSFLCKFITFYLLKLSASFFFSSTQALCFASFRSSSSSQTSRKAWNTFCLHSFLSLSSFFLFCWLKKLQRLLTFPLTDSRSSTSSLKSHNMCIPTYLTTFSFSSFPLTSPLYHHRQTDLTNLEPTKQHLSLSAALRVFISIL